MILLAALPVLYIAILVLVARLSVRPYRLPTWISPGSLGAPFEEILFTTEDGIQLSGWWVPAEGATHTAVLCHGYMMNRSELTPEAGLLWHHGISCLLFDFRGHGRSQRAVCTVGARERLDVLAAWEAARRLQPGTKIIAHGSSMGASASILALSEDPAAADLLVADSAYSKLSAASVGWWRFLLGRRYGWILVPTLFAAWPMTRINPFKIDIATSLEKIGEKPVLFFHGRSDTLVPEADAQRNFDHALGPKEIVWFDGHNHSEGRWLEASRYHRHLIEFLRRNGVVQEKDPVR